MRRIPELDALRGIAALVILVFHLRFMDRAPALQSAVDLFFVLSGYLITAILLRSRRDGRSLRNFYARRSLRIWPAYFAALLACILLNPLLPRPEPLAGAWQFATFTPFVQKYWGGAAPAFSRMFLHAWTLAIEEQFYFLWPLVWFAFGRAGLWLTIPAWVVLPIALRAAGLQPTLLFTRCDGLALGGLLALVLERREVGLPARFDRALAALLVFALLPGALGGLPPIQEPLAAILGTPAWKSLRILAMNLAFFALVGLVVQHSGHRRLRLLRRPGLLALGRISYGLYLYHPIAFAMTTVLQRRLGWGGSPAIDAFKLAASFGLAVLSWRCLERPILSLRGRFAEDREKAGTTPRPHFDPTPAREPTVTP